MAEIVIGIDGGGTFTRVAEDLTALRERGTQGFEADGFERNRRFGAMAPLVTAAARNGAPLARTVCDAAADALGIGIRLVGNCFTRQTVSVALVGSVVRSDYMQQGIKSTLAKSERRHYQIVHPAFPSEVGAVLMALARHGIAIDAAVLSGLSREQQTREQEPPCQV